jgi:hypothetical protein
MRAAKNLWDRRKPPQGAIELESPVEPASRESPGSHEADWNYGRPKEPRYVFPNDLLFREWMVNFPMSRLSRVLLPHFRLDEIASKRRANYQWLVERLAEFPEVRPVSKQLTAGVVPWVLAFTIGDRSDAHMALRAQGIPAVTWGGVRDRRISAGEFPDADFLYEHLIFLPIHQDLEAAHLERIADAVGMVCRAGRVALRR